MGKTLISSLMILSLLLSGCQSACQLPSIRPTCCLPLQRPQVIATWNDCVIDYNDCFEEFSFGDCPPESLKLLERAPLTEDMFDPYEPLDNNYQLARGDILEIGIVGETDAYVQNITIAPDGKLYYGVLDGIEAEGRTPEDISRDLADGLKHLYIDPKVTIVPVETFSYSYRILGRINGPGEYIMRGPITVREAINEAGGLMSETLKDTVNYPQSNSVPFVDFSRSFLVRGNKKLDIDFESLIFTGDNSQDIYMRPGDYLYFAANQPKEVYVLGYVSAPQRVPYMENLTLMTALSTVGGWPSPNPYSPDLNNFLVIRGSLCCPQVCRVDITDILNGCALDVRLQPGDIVYAQHKQFRFGRELIRVAIDSFIYSFIGSWFAHLVDAHWFGPIIEDDDV